MKGIIKEKRENQAIEKRDKKRVKINKRKGKGRNKKGRKEDI